MTNQTKPTVQRSTRVLPGDSWSSGNRVSGRDLLALRLKARKVSYVISSVMFKQAHWAAQADTWLYISNEEN